MAWLVLGRAELVVSHGYRTGIAGLSLGCFFRGGAASPMCFWSCGREVVDFCGHSSIRHTQLLVSAGTASVLQSFFSSGSCAATHAMKNFKVLTTGQELTSFLKIQLRLRAQRNGQDLTPLVRS